MPVQPAVSGKDARPDQLQQVNALLRRLADLLARQLFCQATALACVSPDHISFLAHHADHVQPTVAYVPAGPDPALLALLTGRLDAVVYTNTAKTQSAVARFFHNMGCRAVIGVPLDTSDGQAILFVGFTSLPEALAETVSDLIVSLAPRLSAISGNI
ncbi:MAG: hypothetical protein H5T86_00605 [Armatimonadetes bacterium]|nr:hypothetical protein [Armatimonadota bacterium]